MLRRRLIRRVTSLPIVYPQGYCVRRRRGGGGEEEKIPFSSHSLSAFQNSRWRLNFPQANTELSLAKIYQYCELKSRDVLVHIWLRDTQANFKRGLPQASHLIKKTLPMIMASFVHQKYIIMDKKPSLNMWNSTNHIKTLLDTFQRLVKFSFVFCEVSPLILWPGIKT